MTAVLPLPRSTTPAQLVRVKANLAKWMNRAMSRGDFDGVLWTLEFEFGVPHIHLCFSSALTLEAKNRLYTYIRKVWATLDATPAFTFRCEDVRNPEALETYLLKRNSKQGQHRIPSSDWASIGRTWAALGAMKPSFAEVTSSDISLTLESRGLTPNEALEATPAVTRILTRHLYRLHTRRRAHHGRSASPLLRHPGRHHLPRLADQTLRLLEFALNQVYADFHSSRATRPT